MTNTATILHGGTPEATRAAGLAPRYHFWLGASGQRYLFTQVSPDTLRHFRNVVALAAERARDGRLVGRAAMAIEAGSAEPILRQVAGPTQFFAHLLAGSPAERRRVVQDLLAPEASAAIAA